MVQFEIDVNALRKLMIDKSIDTISLLAKKAGLNRNTLYKVLNGKQLPTANIMYRLIEVLDISSEEAGRIFFVKKTYVKCKLRV